MKFNPTHLFCAAALALALPVLGLSDAVSINGTCETGGTCTPTAIGYPGSSSGSTSNNITVSGDPFNVTTSYSATFSSSGTSVTADPTVTYTGTSALTHSDVVTINIYQSFFYPGTGVNYNGTYTESFPFSVPTDATAAGELFLDGEGVGALGPYGPGTYDISKSATLTGLNGNTLTYDFQFTFDFNAGLAPGAMASSTPEPAQTIPVAVALVGCAFFALLRRKQATSLL